MNTLINYGLLCPCFGLAQNFQIQTRGTLTVWTELQGHTFCRLPVRRYTGAVPLFWGFVILLQVFDGLGRKGGQGQEHYILILVPHAL